MKRDGNHLKKSSYICVLILAAVLCMGCTDREENQIQYREEGIQLLQNGDYEGALENLQNALDLSLGKVGKIEMDICFYKAEALYYLGDIQGAMDTYSAIIGFNENPKAYFLRGNLYYSQNDEAHALEDYAAAAEHEKKDYELYIGIYEALTAHGKEQEAQIYLNQALELSGNKAYDKMQKGRINFLLGEEDTAVSLLEEAVEENELTAYYYLAEIYSAMDDTKASEEYMSLYMKSGEADSEQLLQIANNQLEKANYSLAIECLDTALKLEKVPNKQILMKTRVVVYEQSGNFAAAKEAMEQYIENYPNDEEAKRELTFLETR